MERRGNPSRAQKSTPVIRSRENLKKRFGWSCERHFSSLSISKTLAQQRSSGKAGYLTLSISRHRIDTQVQTNTHSNTHAYIGGKSRVLQL